jgi:acyl-CoA reductase-like NAD-dependent aldehyde dehydrogenase
MLRECLKYPLSIAGFTSCDFFSVKSPYSQEVYASVGQANEEAISLAVGLAKETFENVIRVMPAHKRSQILSKTSELILENREDLAATIVAEGGKPLKDARLEVSRAANTFAIAARECLCLDGEQLAMDSQVGNEGRLAMVLREPIGVVAAITPFNFPLNLVAHKLAPALAAGNTVVLKPASQTPVSSFKLAQLLKEAGLPDGALILTPCPGAKGMALVRDPRLALLTFTGSQEVGWHLRREVHAGVRVILELGGNAGIVVHHDGDLDAAARATCRGAFAHAGQVCISVQRVYVHEEVYDKFLARLSDLVGALKVGDPAKEDTDVGPMIDKGSLEKTLTWVQEAVSQGARLVCGGQSLGNNVLAPVVLANTSACMNVVCQEVFAPVVSVMKYDTIGNALAAMNNSRYGLQAGVFSSNVDVAFKLARGIDAGGVIVNDAPIYRADHMPYGGRKESGLGLEGVRYALSEMTQPKFICLNLNTNV